MQPGPGPFSEFSRKANSQLEEARLTDKQRVGLLLEAASLLAALDRGQCTLTNGWRGAGVDSDHHLAGLNFSQSSGPAGSQQTSQNQLRQLALRLFGATKISGRGEARRATRWLVDRWAEDLVPTDPTRWVATILRQCSFLWTSSFASVRRRLVWDQDPRNHNGDGAACWVAAPAAIQRRLLGSSSGAKELRDLLASDRGRVLWEGEYLEGDAMSLASQGRWYHAVRCWEENPPKTADEKMARATALFSLGRFESALEGARSIRRVEARILKARCLYFLGRLPAARKMLRSLKTAQPTDRELVDLADLGTRLFPMQDQGEEAQYWIDRALEATRDTHHWRVSLVAAEACWDRKELESMKEWLQLAEPLREDSRWAWSWFRVRALLAMAEGDGPGVVENESIALRRCRRHLTRSDAAGLWNDLAVGRWQMGDLGASERACGHAARLLARCEGPRRQTLALRNLAELRLRRGRLLGVQEILEKSLVRNRLDGNLRGTAEDAGLWARWELVHGRATSALRTCEEVLGNLDEAGSDWHRSELRVLAARALGFLGRIDEARSYLKGSEDAVRDLEPEERPAVWVHAGDRERALSAVPEGAIGGLWTAALTGHPFDEKLWNSLDSLEPFRMARLILDLELTAFGSVDPARVRWAVNHLRRMGAVALAARLEARSTGPWEALSTYLTTSDEDEGALARLFAAAGCSPARLSTIDAGREKVLVEGPSGGEELMGPVGEAVLRLEIAKVDPVVRALFRLVLREMSGANRGVASSSKIGEIGVPAARIPGMIGDSPALLSALKNLPQLASGEMPLLVLGESGTGKELVAGQVHHLSPRSSGPFVPFNCAAVAEQLVLSDLFGHVRGAFTGADRDRMGVFESARGGTVFLDEIGDLPAAAQGMLLRVLQEKEIRRVGETLPRRVDVRIVAATHHGLAQMVEEGTFRRDLYFRLRVAEVKLPALRDRGSDVLHLARHFLRDWGYTGGLGQGVEQDLLQHDWPGNVRELRNVLEVAMALADSGTIHRDHLQLPQSEDALSTKNRPILGSYHQQVLDFRKQLVLEALNQTAGNRSQAARRLGVTRQALTYLIKTLEIVGPFGED